MIAEEKKFQEGRAAAIAEMQSCIDAAEARNVELARIVRRAGIKVARFAGLHDRLREANQGRDIYHPDNVLNLIDDVLLMAHAEIQQRAEQYALLLERMARTEERH